jgi:hypothetical protein
MDLTGNLSSRNKLIVLQTALRTAAVLRLFGIIA